MSALKIQDIPNAYVIFDLETTGINTNTCHIVEVAAIKILDGEIVDRFHSFVNPGRPIPKKAIEVHHITDDMVSDAPSIHYVILDFLRFVDYAVLVAHNASSYDIPIIERVAIDCCGIHLFHSYVDSLPWFRSRISSDSFKLIDICAGYGVINHAAHRAMGDCEALFECIRCCESGAPFSRDAAFEIDAPNNQPSIVSTFSEDDFDLETDYLLDMLDAPAPFLQGKTIVTTGVFQHCGMGCFEDYVKFSGGKFIKKDDFKSADYLIVGKRNRRQRERMSTKEKRAHEITVSGGHVDTILERDFLRLITSSVSAAPEQLCFSGVKKNRDVLNFVHDVFPERFRTHLLFTMRQRLQPKYLYSVYAKPIEPLFFPNPVYGLLFYVLRNGNDTYLQVHHERTYEVLQRLHLHTVSHVPDEVTVTKAKPYDGYVYIDVPMETIPSDILRSLFLFVLRNAVSDSPFGCCYKCYECSDAKECVSDYPLHSLFCMYNENLSNGRIFYGQNKNYP